MDYEKLYKKALERASKLRFQNPFDTVSQMMEHVFPELKESEDERIRKSIIAIINNYVDNSNTFKPKMIAWLENQGQVKESPILQQENKTCCKNGNSLTCEDERIKEDIISYIKVANQILPQFQIGKWISWLEKQDKSKWTDEDEERLQSCIIELQGKGLMGGVDTMDSKWLKSLKQRIYVSSAKNCKNEDTLLDLLNKMPSCITVDEIDYHFVMKKTIFYKAYYEGEGEEGKGKVIFMVTAYSPIYLLTAMLNRLKEKGLLE